MNQAQAGDVTALKAGHITVVMRRFELDPYLAINRSFKITDMGLVPSVGSGIIMSGLGEECSLKTVKTAINGGAPLRQGGANKIERVA